MSWLGWFRSPGEPARVAPVGYGHCPALASIHGTAFARPWAAHDFEGFVADPAIRVDGLFLGAAVEPAGFIVSRQVVDEAEILSLALGRAARGHGLSRVLLAQHLNTVAHAGVKRVHLEVEEGNEPALALYRRAGFAQSGHRPGYYARPDGTRASALSMTLDLAGPGR